MCEVNTYSRWTAYFNNRKGKMKKNDKQTDEKQNIRDILILDYIKNIHPMYLHPDFRITVEFIKFVFHIR